MANKVLFKSILIGCFFFTLTIIAIPLPEYLYDFEKPLKVEWLRHVTLMESYRNLPVGVPLNKVQLIEDNEFDTIKKTGYLFVGGYCFDNNLEILFRSKDGKNDPYICLYFHQLSCVTIKKIQKQNPMECYDVDTEEEKSDTIIVDTPPWE